MKCAPAVTSSVNELVVELLPLDATWYCDDDGCVLFDFVKAVSSLPMNILTYELYG